MSTPGYSTLEAVRTIHRATALAKSPLISEASKKELAPLTDAVLSFVGYSLRIAEPRCRPEQLAALNKLNQLVNTLERQ